MKNNLLSNRVGRTLAGFAAMSLICLTPEICFPSDVAKPARETSVRVLSESVLPVPVETLRLDIFKGYPPYIRLVSQYLDPNTPEETRDVLREGLWNLDRIRVMLLGFSKDYSLFSASDAEKRKNLMVLLRRIQATPDISVTDFCNHIATGVNTVADILAGKNTEQNFSAKQGKAYESFEAAVSGR